MHHEQRDQDAHQEEDQHGVLDELDVLAVVGGSGVVSVIVAAKVVEALEEVSTWTKA